MITRNKIPSITINDSDIDPITEARFWSHVAIDWRPDACWEWIGYEDGDYGRFKFGPSRISPNRFAHALFHGATPEGAYVCHKCDRPRCVRPDHLFLGDAAINCADKVSKGRHAFGEKTGTAKLAEAQASRILGSKGIVSQRVLAEEFGISKRAVQKIHSRENWKHLRCRP